MKITKSDKNDFLWLIAFLMPLILVFRGEWVASTIAYIVVSIFTMAGVVILKSKVEKLKDSLNAKNEKEVGK